MIDLLQRDDSRIINAMKYKQTKHKDRHAANTMNVKKDY
jgi:hypothetical protein